MRVGFYSYDVGPSRALGVVAEEAKRRGHEVVVFPPQIRGYAQEHFDEMLDRDIFVLGLSSFQTQEELALVDVLALHCPLVNVEDVPWSSLRPKARAAAGLFTRNFIGLPSVVGVALQFGYQENALLCVGPPPHFARVYEEMIADREGVRVRFKARNQKGDLTDVSPLAVVLYVPGTTQPQLTNDLLEGALLAGQRLVDPDHLSVIFRPHPGERPETEDEKPMYEREFARRESLLNEIFWRVETGGLSHAQIVGAQDVITCWTGGPTESILGAYAGVDSVFLYNDLCRQMLVDQGTSYVRSDQEWPSEPNGRWFVAELGATIKVTDHDEMERAISQLLTYDEKLKIRVFQRNFFPLPQSWDTAPLIVNELERIVP